MKPQLLYRDDVSVTQALPTNIDAMMGDLELDTLFSAMAAGDGFLYSAAKEVILTAPPEPATILYRQQILDDCLQQPTVFQEIYGVALEALDVQRQHYFGFIRANPGSTLSGSIDVLDAYIPLLRHVRTIAMQSASMARSPGFKRFIEMVQHELSDTYLDEIATHVRNLKSGRGVLLEAAVGHVGTQIDYRFLRPAPTGWRDFVPSVLSHDAYSFDIAPRDDAGFQALESMRNRGVMHVTNAVAHAADHVRAFFEALRTELAFYLGCLNLYGRLMAMNLPVCFPTVTHPGQAVFSATGLYDVSLALQLGEQGQVVGNDIAADGISLVIITGANQGGKSTFLRGIGLMQLMAQCGMFVPAAQARMNIVTGLFTHYKREEDTTMTVGKFEEEVRRMSDIADAIASGSLLLCNESFSSTNEREGAEIGRQVVDAMTDTGVKVFYVTHLYDLAHAFERHPGSGVLLLRAERKESGQHTFKLLERPPLATSYGKDLYCRIFDDDDAVCTETAPTGMTPALDDR